MGIVLVYDCTEEMTFNNIANWLKQIQTHAGENVAKVLVANKIDLPDRKISTEMGEALAKEHGLTFFETSARNGVNINELFYHLAQQILKDLPASNPSGVGNGVSRSQFQQNSLDDEPHGLKLGDG